MDKQANRVGQDDPNFTLEDGDAAIVWHHKEQRYSLHIPMLGDDEEMEPAMLFFVAMSMLPEKHPELYEEVIDTFLASVEADDEEGSDPS